MTTFIPGSVVVGVDGSAHSQAALEWGALQAQRMRQPLHLVRILPRDYSVTAALANAPERPALEPVGARRASVAATLTARHDLLEPEVDQALRLVPDLTVTSEAICDNAGPALIERSRHASVLVTGARGRGSVRSAFLGSVSLHVAMQADCPVVVIREHPQPDSSPPRIVVGIDGSAASQPALEFAFAQAAACGVGLTVVHAWWLEFADGALRTLGPADRWDALVEEQLLLVSQCLAGMQEKYPDVNVRKHVLRAHPVEALVDHSVGAELVVVGSRGRGGFAGLLLGSVSHAVLQRSLCPVAVVRERNGR